VLGALSKLSVMEKAPSPSSPILLGGFAPSPSRLGQRVSPRVASPRSSQVLSHLTVPPPDSPDPPGVESEQQKRPAPLLIQGSEEDVLGALSKLSVMEKAPSPSSPILLGGFAPSPSRLGQRVSPRVGSSRSSLSHLTVPSPRMLGLAGPTEPDSPPSGLGTPLYPGSAASSPQHSRLPAQLEEFLRDDPPPMSETATTLAPATSAPIQLEDLDNDEEAMIDMLLDTLSL